ncbi:MAG TPA: patatin-like phospholipase family protein [Stellaceae bacterium]|nr:patatin-like phospholipase family protein [Stellaceae bacterium]
MAAEQARRKLLYKVGHQLDLSALCLSGGGIRSAAISLGVIQGLADHGVLDKFDYLSTVSGGGYIGSWLSAWLYRVRRAGGSSDDVLKRLGSRRNAPDVEVPPLNHLREYSNYLTPKLGIFSADTWAALAIVLRNIVVNWLILLPVLAILVTVVKLIALGLTAPAPHTPAQALDQWSLAQEIELSVAILCWACGGVGLGYKLYRLYRPAYSQIRRGPEQLADQKAMRAAQGWFIWFSLLPAVIGGFCFVWLAYNKLTPGLFSNVFSDLWPNLVAIAAAARHAIAQSLPAEITAFISAHVPDTFPALVVFALCVYALALVIGWTFAAVAAMQQVFHRPAPIAPAANAPAPNPPAANFPAQPQLNGARRAWAAICRWFVVMPRWFAATFMGRWLAAILGIGRARAFNIHLSDFLSWIIAVLVFAAMICGGAFVINAMGAPITGGVSIGGVTVQREALIAIFGVPWFLLTTILAHDIYLLLDSTSPYGDVEREWLARGSGWHFIVGLAWIILFTVVLLGPAVYYFMPQTVHVVTVISGTVTALLGKSGLTSASGEKSDWKGLAANIGLAVAGPIFAVLLLILLSVVIDWVVFGYHYPCLPTDSHWDRCRSGDWLFSLRWLLPLGISVLTLLLADRCSNVNAFSLHAVYRNRLIRCFLGGARDPHRHPDGFTDFDWDDDLRVAELWRLPRLRGEWRPFHVINMTLNVADTNRLSWQQRKAMPFSVSPLSCGNADLGYRPTWCYAGPPPKHDPQPDQEIRSGISLGTAMAISGAAVSSNMGYHSSMSLSFLLTFFNVRLGVWLGNPGKAGQRSFVSLAPQPYEAEGPPFAVRPLVSELFGLTSGDSQFVYLSDGGHFENLGLYEMVRRRCRWIVVVDAGQDASRGYADLGNAVRKIWIDLGIRVTFDNSPLLKADKDAKPDGVPYFAIGTVNYLSDPPVDIRQADGSVVQGLAKGKILYLKAVVRGDEGAADVIAYKRANKPFPDQSTADQWFDESQFEAYRRLGQLMVERIVGAATSPVRDFSSLFGGLKGVDPSKVPPPSAGAGVSGAT